MRRDHGSALRGAALSGALFGVLAASRAAADSGYAGKYVGTPARVEATVTAWGADCGTRPQSYTASESPSVEVRDQGAHLAIVYRDRTLRTNACWSPNPTVKLASTSAADNRWRTECRTPAGEARKESGRYTVTAKGPRSLELVEESDYDWRLNESHCVARVRIVQVLELADGKPKPAAAAAPEPACVPGPITRLRLRPVEARLEPGGRVCFQPKAFDAQACPADVDGATLRWELKKPNGTRATLVNGCFRAAEAAADGEGTFEVLAEGEGLRAEATVIVAAPDLSDITARRGASPAAAPLESAAPALGSGLAGAGVRAVGVDHRVRWGWLSLLGAAALAVIGGGALWLVRQRRRRVPTPRPARGPAPATVAEAGADPDLPARRTAAAMPAPAPSPAVEPAPAPAVAAHAPARAPDIARSPAQVSSGEPLICPTCRQGYAPGSTRCSADGSPLLTYSEYTRRARQADGHPVVCPACGAKLQAGAAFCGVCGKRLGS